jgi:NADH:ubiquinone oxidoreductase subunit 5 (subunit L)/multisubunit Na+/H+ antiporter MnhA subunit
MGFPFLAGFYSKDLIIEFVFSSFRVDSFIIG